MRKVIILTIFLKLISVQLNAQIINVESLRQTGKDKVWTGSAKLNFQYVENKNTFFLVNNLTRIQRKKDKQLYLFINDYNLKISNDEKIVSKGIQHFRYNYKLKTRLTLEAFFQNQFDEISLIKFRRLIGSGLRTKLSKKEDYKFYSGVLLMKEFERLNDDFNTYNKDWRLSIYFSFSLYPTKSISISSTTYYQPNIDEFSDFRLSNDTGIALKLTKSLSFNSRILYTYDANPALSIPKSQFKFVNGLAYSF